MKNYLKVITSQQGPVTANALAPVIGYEPWSLRSLESIKSSIANGIPVLIRLHSAADYPTGDEESAHRLDMESHCVLIAGYNDDEETFDVVDPWNTNWGGQYGGVGKLPYEALHVVCVNCTAEKALRFSLISHEVRASVTGGNASLAVKLGYYVPLGYIIDRNNTKFEMFNVTIQYECNGSVKQQTQSLTGEWGIGDDAVFAFPLEKELSGDVRVKIGVLATLLGERPYPYRDQIQMEFTESVNINRTNNLLQRENLIFSINASNY